MQNATAFLGWTRGAAATTPLEIERLRAMRSCDSQLQCHCRIAQLNRIKRDMWMRLIPNLRLFLCSNCNQEVFAAKSPEPVYFSLQASVPSGLRVGTTESSNKIAAGN